ncbi:MAG: GlsB/YeaQ/YmgE family stress response membrane protein [Rubrobacteraceae bacterium]
MPGPDPGGIIVTILIGIAGAFVGGWLLSLVGLGTVGGFSIGSILTAVVGAIVLLAIYRVITRRVA